jgi:hypothetical protein
MIAQFEIEDKVGCHKEAVDFATVSGARENPARWRVLTQAKTS